MVYDTLSEAVNDLQKKGYTYDFVLTGDSLQCNKLDYALYPDQFKIDEFHRFEGASDPDDNSILFAVSSDTFNVKGLLVDAYGAYSDPISADMIQKLKTH